MAMTEKSPMKRTVVKEQKGEVSFLDYAWSLNDAR